MPTNTPQYGQLANIMGQPQQTIPDKAKQPQGTGFTNLQTILGANQGNQLGQTVVGGVQNVGNQAQQSLQKQQTQFGQDIGTQKQHLAGEQGLVSGAFGKVDQPQVNEGDITEGDASGFQNLRNEQYGGPKGLQDADQLQRQAQQAAQYGQLAGSRAGRQELLQTMVGGGNPGYTPAQQRLDELFLAQSQPALRQAAQQQRQIPGQIQRAITSAQGQGQAQAAALQQLQNNAAQGIQNRQSSIGGAIDTAQQAAVANEGQRQADFAAYQKAIANNDLSGASALQNKANLIPTGTSQDITQMMQLLGPQIGGALANDLSAGQVATTRGDVASSTQRAQIDALAKLAGTQGEFTNFTPGQNVGASFKTTPDFANQARNSAQALLYTHPSNPYMQTNGPGDNLAQIEAANPNYASQVNQMLSYNNQSDPGINQLRQLLSGQTTPTANDLINNNPYAYGENTTFAQQYNPGIATINEGAYTMESRARQAAAQQLANKYNGQS